MVDSNSPNDRLEGIQCVLVILLEDYLNSYLRKEISA